MIQMSHMVLVLIRDDCTNTFDVDIHPMAFRLQIFMCNYDMHSFKSLGWRALSLSEKS